MKRVSLLLAGACIGLMLLAGTGSAQAAPEKMRTGWLDEHETFMIWYAVDKGWDKEEGLDIEILYFDSGMALLNALPSGEWVIGGGGSVPGMMGNLRHNTYIVAIGNDESKACSIMVRPDSPMAKVKGYNKDYPDVLGDPASVKGKTILCTTVSSVHYTLWAWLKALGLSDSDVVIKNMDQSQALSAFSTGIGDIVALWAPYMYVGEDKGWRIAGTASNCKIGMPLVLIADKKFADANPEKIAKFLRVYFRAVNMVKNESPESLVPDYRRFFLEWAGKNYTPEVALKDLLTHSVFTLDEQLALFDSSKGKSQAQIWMSEAAQFFAAVGRITQDEFKKVGDSRYVTDKFLKLVKTPIPPYK